MCIILIKCQTNAKVVTFGIILFQVTAKMLCVVYANSLFHTKLQFPLILTTYEEVFIFRSKTYTVHFIPFCKSKLFMYLVTS